MPIRRTSIIAQTGESGSAGCAYILCRCHGVYMDLCMWLLVTVLLMSKWFRRLPTDNCIYLQNTECPTHYAASSNALFCWLLVLHFCCGTKYHLIKLCLSLLKLLTSNFLPISMFATYRFTLFWTNDKININETVQNSRLIHLFNNPLEKSQNIKYTMKCTQAKVKNETILTCTLPASLKNKQQHISEITRFCVFLEALLMVWCV